MTKIAVVQTAFPGDVVLSLAVFEALKDLRPGCQTAAVVRPESACMLESHPHIDCIIPFDKYGRDKGLRGIGRTFARLHGYDEAYIIQRHLRSGLIPFLARIPRRVGFDISAAASFYTERVKYAPELHEVARCLSLLGIENTDRKYKPRLFITPKAEETAEKLLGENGIRNSFAAVAPGSVWATKRYPRFASIIDLIYDRFDLPVVIIGGPGDKGLASKLVRSVAHLPADLTGRTDLMLSTAIISKAKFVISNDSAPAHIAAAVDTPVIAVFGSTVPSFGFAPYSDNSTVIDIGELPCRPCGPHGSDKCPERHFKCMEDLSPEKIIEAARLLLAR